MSPSFNLIDQAWIPCVTVDGDLIEVSLRDLLQRAPELREIACATPIQSAAVLPLVLAILHRVFGPARLAEWKALWDASAFDMAPIDAYFAQWHQRFDLFHPQRPFLSGARRARKTQILDPSCACQGQYRHAFHPRNRRKGRGGFASGGGSPADHFTVVPRWQFRTIHRWTQSQLQRQSLRARGDLLGARLHAI